MKFYGVADAHGLESFQPFSIADGGLGFSIDDKTLHLMYMRAMSYRHLHSVIYQVDLGRNDAIEISKLFNSGKLAEALTKLKETAITISLAKIPGAEKSWAMIPNSAIASHSS